MKKNLLSLCALAIATVASASTERYDALPRTIGQNMTMETAVPDYGSFGNSLPDKSKASGNAFKSHARIATADIPTGITKVYTTDWMCLFGSHIVDNTGIASILHFAEDSNDVYFYDFFGQGEDYWLAATIDENGIISIPMHQYAYDDSRFGPLTIELSRFVFGDDTMSSEIDPEATDYKLQLGEDGIIRSIDLDLEWTERSYPILTSEYGGTFALAGSIVMTEVTDQAVTPPADTEPVKYSYSYTMGFDTDKFAGFCNVIDDGKDVYIQGLCPALENIWLKGTYSDNHEKLIFKSNQYMGFDIYVHYFNAAHRVSKEVDGEWTDVWELDPELVLNVSEEDKTLAFDNQSYFTVTIADDVAYFLANGVLQPYEDKPAVPAAPTNLELIWVDVDALSFIQPLMDMEGNVINSNYLSWRMYIDEKPFTFDPSVYQNLTEPMFTIPYMFDDGWDFFSYGDDQVVALYDTNFKNIGVQSVYTVDGVENVSEITYIGETGVEKLATGGSEVMASEYYDLTGRRVLNPDKGVYIRVDTRADGNTVSVKETL